MNIFAQGVGMLVDDEITQSGDPSKHASDLVANLVKNSFRYACLHITPQNELAAPLLRAACRASGKIAFTTWSQNMEPSDQIANAMRWESEGHAANAESTHEEGKWTNVHLYSLHQMMKGNVANICTEGTWGRDKVKAERWYSKGYFGMFEAIESENSQATINAMADLANQLGFPVEQRGFTLYLNRGYPSSEYTDMIAETRGRWSIFRYGDVDQKDWDEFAKWPKISIPAVLPGLGIEDAHRIVIQALLEVNKRQAALGRGALGPNAALVNAGASSRAALDGKWTSAMGAEFAALRAKHGV